MLIKRQTALLGCLALLAPAACGDDGDAATGASGVSARKRIGELTRAELIAFCRWTEEQEFTLPVRSECEGDAVFQTRTKAECEATRDACLTSEPEKRREDLALGQTRCDASQVVPRVDCASTVAEFEACIDDTMAAQRAFYGSLTCDMANSGLADHVPEPASCAPIDFSCKP